MEDRTMLGIDPRTTMDFIEYGFLGFICDWSHQNQRDG